MGGEGVKAFGGEVGTKVCWCDVTASQSVFLSLLLTQKYIIYTFLQVFDLPK